MALTLNQSLVDRTYYRNGSDYFLVETGEEVEPTEEMLLAEEQAAVDTTDENGTGEDEEIDLGWTFVPVSEHRRVAGVEGATRVGSYEAGVTIAGVDADGPFYGIDAADFAGVAYFRDDFSPSQLDSLLGCLAMDSSALLVSPEFLQNLNLEIGDRIELAVEIYDRSEDIIFTVAGVISYFPTFYPTGTNPYLFVGNLDYLFEEMGGEYPYDVWLRTSAPMAPEQLQQELAAYDLRVTSIRDSRAAIAEEQAEPERTGMFGILSVGLWPRRC
jgi:putative ABC transport system permease protein